MTRVAFLVAVLAALCYTSQAIPVQENVEGTQALPYGFMDNAKEMFDSFLEKAKDKSKEVYAEAKKVIEKFYDEGQNAKIKFNKKVEELQKWYQEKKVSAEQFYEQLKKITQETEKELKDLLKKQSLKVEELVKNMINGNEIKRELEEILEKLPKQSGETYGMADMEELVENKLKEYAEKAQEMVNKIKEQGKAVSEELKKHIKEVKDYLEKGWENWKNMGDMTKLLEMLKKEMSKILNGQQVQQTSLTTSYGIEGIIKEVDRLVCDILNGAGKITEESINIPWNILKGMGGLLNRRKN